MGLYVEAHEDVLGFFHTRMYLVVRSESHVPTSSTVVNTDTYIPDISVDTMNELYLNTESKSLKLKLITKCSPQRHLER